MSDLAAPSPAHPPITVGLVGAGPWARRVHAPMLAAGPHTRLGGVWSRRPEAAKELAVAFGADACPRYDDLLDTCDAIAFAVPPQVQAELAAIAARSGRPVLLEKPLAADLDGARALADVIGETGVASQMVLTWRYSAEVREFLGRVAALEPFGGRAAYVSGGLLGEFATPWRLERGAVLDVGPHMVDLLSAALGPVAGAVAHGDPLRWTGMLLQHEGGAVSELSLCMNTPLPEHRAWIEVYGRHGGEALDASRLGPEIFTTLAAEFAETVRRGGGHPLDAAHGLRLQETIAAVEEGLAR
ncbi:Gfo/Idh/MocA family protein [Rhizohabitans arisaemae]|uniref:Gfo/Idh/MocA family protein n=1 Tax=Rhizohabitans arisaemae TaxID=2720610 RepID=UPI0024B188BF|nr:Gfo/Idh/MocA family oxidoreductase [Rhizohabitans arisaemae]